jgi:hypothetical protein
MTRAATERPCCAILVAAALILTLVPSLSAQRDATPMAAWDEPTEFEPSGPDAMVVPGEIIVGLAADVDRPVFGAELSGRGMEVIGEIPRLRALRLRVGQWRTPQEACEVARRIPGVAYAEPNGIGQAAALAEPSAAIPPDDTWFSAQWHLQNTGQSGGKVGADIDALSAWAIQSNSPDVVVALLDTGIDYAHPEFAGRLLQGYDFVDEDDDATATHPHGIHVAGLLGAVGNNHFGVCGVAPGCRILPVRVLGPGIMGTIFDVAQGIDYCASQGADILSMSLVSGPSQLMQAALQSASEAGAILVAAAGNLGPGTADANWPSASPWVLGIGATTKDDQRASFSATGTVVDFVAPGSEVITVAASHDDSKHGFSGTSASTPIASGIVALLLSYNPYLTQDQVYALLQAGAEDQVGNPLEDTPGWDPYYGHGRLNAFRSLQALCSCSADDAFTVSPPKLSLGVEGTWVFRLSAGSANAAQPYLMLGTLSGAGPGFVLGQTPWPLAFDSYTRLCLSGPSPLIGGVGVLDADGNAVATLTLPAAARETLAGAMLHHAAAVYDGALIRPFDGVPLLLSAPTASGIHELPQRLFLEDFEVGAPGWVFDNGVNGQWHIADPGECGAPSRRAACNAGEPSCAFGNATTGRLVSPSVLLTGLPPYRIRLTSTTDVPEGSGKPVLLKLVDETTVASLKTHEWTPANFGEPVAGTTSTYELIVPESSKYEGRFVHLEAVFTAPSTGSGAGWSLDDVAVWNAGH